MKCKKNILPALCAIALAAALGACGLIQSQTVLNTPSYSTTGNSMGSTFTMSSSDAIASYLSYGVNIYYKFYIGSASVEALQSANTDLTGTISPNYLSLDSISAGNKLYRLRTFTDDSGQSDTPVPTLPIGTPTSWSVQGTIVSSGNYYPLQISFGGNSYYFYRYASAKDSSNNKIHKSFNLSSLSASDNDTSSLNSSFTTVSVAFFAQVYCWKDVTSTKQYSLPVLLGVYQLAN